MRLTMEIPRPRLWHLLGLVATVAAFLATFDVRKQTEDPTHRAIRQLRSSDATERAEAASHLGSTRRPERRAIGPLTEALFDADPTVRAWAAWALGSIVEYDKAAPESPSLMAALARGLDDPAPEARRRMILTLARFDVEPKAIFPALLGLVRGDPEARDGAIDLLGRYARRDESARSAVFEALGDADPEIRILAIKSLPFCAIAPDPAPRPLQDAILAALDGVAAGDESRKVRASAVGILTRISSQSGIESPRIIEALGDPDADIRLAAADNLAWRWPPRRSPGPLISALGRLLKDADPRVRLATATTLGRLGLDAAPTLPSLRDLADDPEEATRKAAATSIGEIEKATKGLRDVIAGLGGSEPGARSYAAGRLGAIGPAAAEAVPALAKLLADPDAEVRRASAEALGKIGPAARPSIPALAERAEVDEDEGVRKASTEAATTLRKPEAPGGVQ